LSRFVHACNCSRSSVDISNDTSGRPIDLPPTLFDADQYRIIKTISETGH
jgi:hypothetical protein